MEEKERTYTLIVKKCRIPVSEEVYKAYYKLKERERYFDKLSAAKHISFEASMDSGIQIEYVLASSQESLEDSIITKDMIEKMLKCLTLLDDDEQHLIRELFFAGKSERQLSKDSGIPLMTINDRKKRILKKLKKLLEK